MAILCLGCPAIGQESYLPPLSGSEWETLSIEEAGMCAEGVDSLYAYLDAADSKAFILLKDGRIVLERYFGEFTQDSFWYWASAGKTLTAFAVGKAQEEGYLDIQEPSNQYLGEGWTSLTEEQEAAVTIWHQLTMTTGLDDGVPDNHCTLDSCLLYAADPGTRWAYHNAPYTLLDGVIENATGQSLNRYIDMVLKSRIGMNGAFFPLGYNNVYFSTPRSMARFGLLILNDGIWANDTIMEDRLFFEDMVTTSQEVNPSYGYLWWLNGKESYMVPGSQFSFPGNMVPNAPDDMFAAIGKNGQIISVVPSEGLVWIRMGNASTLDAVPAVMTNRIWEYLNGAFCQTTAVKAVRRPGEMLVFPNPADDKLFLKVEGKVISDVHLIAMDGKVAHRNYQAGGIDVGTLASGLYVLRANVDGTWLTEVVAVR